MQLISDNWSHFDQTLWDSKATQFTANIKKRKKASIQWSPQKNIKDDESLRKV